MASNTIVINVDLGESRVALIEDGVLAEVYIERRRERSPVGNIYLGRVTRVLPGMQAAFVDIGLDRAAFLHVEDVVAAKDLEKLVESEEGEEAEVERRLTPRRRRKLSRRTPIRDVLKEGQQLVVQVSKGPIGSKGARVTAHVALPGRYVVFFPTVDRIGVSKRLGGEKDRRKLREVLEGIKPEQGGLVLRRLDDALTKKKLKADVGYLSALWQAAERKREGVKKAPALLHEELDLPLRSVRELFGPGVEQIVVDDEPTYRRLREFLAAFDPERVRDVKLYEGAEPLFDEYGIEEELQRAFSRKVPLPSGGYLIIDQAEALTAIDVNTGRFTGKGGDVEETILQTNLEAVREIAYQLRFRNIGGLIVLDFIDMEKKSHRDKVYRALQEMLKKDRARTAAVRISELGLVEMTRRRTRESLGRTLYEACFYCDGTGLLKSKQTVCHEILRQMRREKDALPGYEIVVTAHPAVCDMLQREEKAALQLAERRFQRRIRLEPRNDYHLEQFDLRGAS